MESLEHILVRAGLHIVSATWVYLVIHFTIQFAERRWKYWKLALPGILTVAFVGWKEVYDIATGANPPIKSFTDGLSWLIGGGLSAWGLYRFRGEVEKLLAWGLNRFKREEENKTGAVPVRSIGTNGR